jgi:DUF2075 family protein/predicted GIY-YIG superfamily endonuclease
MSFGQNNQVDIATQLTRKKMSRQETQSFYNKQLEKLQLVMSTTLSPIRLEDDFTDDFPMHKTVEAEKFNRYINDYPALYILYTQSKPAANLEAYVGETTHLKRRIKEHWKNSERRKLNRVVAISHEAFNQSATYNIESNLISLLLADGKYKLQNKSQVSERLVIHNYFQKKYYNDTVFRDIWNELLDLDIAQSSIEELETRDIFKLSPYKELSVDQSELVNDIVSFCECHINDEKPAVFLIKGEAGTGKSVVLSSLYKRLADLSVENSSSLYETSNYLLVNHSEQLKTYQSIAQRVKGLIKNRFLKPTTFVNKVKSGKIQADVTIVDEAHLLLSQGDAYNGFKETNHLEEIIKASKITIVVYDDKQVLKLKSYWDDRLLQKIIKDYKPNEYTLKEQFRMNADSETIEWIDAFVDKRELRSLPSNNQATGFEFKVFNNASDMYERIKEKSESVKLSRMVATFDYEHKKDDETYYVEEDAFKLPWNTTSDAKTWAEREETIGEVGSIYTVQGFDLNYVGVILGPSISYDEDNDCIKIIPELYRDTEAFRKNKELAIPDMEIQKVKERIILNSVNVLMKRGAKGLYIYASDEKLRARLLELASRRLWKN